MPSGVVIWQPVNHPGSTGSLEIRPSVQENADSCTDGLLFLQNARFLRSVRSKMNDFVYRCIDVAKSATQNDDMNDQSCYHVQNYMNIIVFLSYEDRRSYRVLPCFFKQRDAQRTHVPHTFCLSEGRIMLMMWLYEYNSLIPQESWGE